jgi:type IV pilus assembly protein PilM
MSRSPVLARWFPPPSYLTFPSVGVDLSDTSLKYIRLKRSYLHRAGVALSAWGSIDLPEGAIVSGDVQDIGLLAKALAEVRRRCKTPYIRLSLPEEHAYLFETPIKRDVPLREIRGILEFKLEENVPISPRDAFFDYDIVAQPGDANEANAIVTVCAKDKLQKYYDACITARLIPVSFEVESQAIARAVSTEGQQGSSMIVDFGRTHTGIGITYQGALMHTSAIDIGGQALSDAMRGVLGECTEEELTQMKNTKGLRPTHGDARVRDALIAVTKKIADELRAHIEYWNRREQETSDRAIKRVVLCGGSSNLAGFPEYLAAALGVPAERAEVWRNVFSDARTVPPIPRRYSYGYATAIGLALSGMLIDGL